MAYKRYSKYKDSGVECLGAVPEHWRVSRLKYLAVCRNSNVDKKTVDGQCPVRLCNYTDVYYKERITDAIPFMRATASTEDVQRFSLREGDSIITKDSESPDDIGIPALVTSSAEGVVCGYHLTLIRPNTDVDGPFLFRALESSASASQFHLGASGVTRYGLSKGAIDNLLVPVPRADEQESIAKFLDRETARIDALIEKKRRLIELLKEKRQAVITRAVTKGLDPNVPMKESGVEWLGKVPAHWGVGKTKQVVELVTSGSRGWAEYYSDNGEPFIRITNIQRESSVLDLSDLMKVKLPGNIEGGRTLLRKGDVLVSITADLGSVALVDERVVGGYVSQHVALVRPIYNEDGGWLASALMSYPSKEQFLASGYGGTKTQLSLNDVKEIAIPIPPARERVRLAEHINEIQCRMAKLIQRISRSIELLQLRRSALITAAVTGQIDVREEVSQEVA